MPLKMILIPEDMGHISGREICRIEPRAIDYNE
jgi:hypothetical protein